MRKWVFVLALLAIAMKPLKSIPAEKGADESHQSKMIIQETTGSNLPILGVIGITLIGALVLTGLFLAAQWKAPRKHTDILPEPTPTLEGDEGSGSDAVGRQQAGK